MIDDDPVPPPYTTQEVARRLGLAVRSVQLMVDRGELQAWKTPGGHRRISRESVEQWLARRSTGAAVASPTPTIAADTLPPPVAGTPTPTPTPAGDVLVIEDSKHYQTLVGLLLREHFPQWRVHLADDGIAGLAMAGRLQPRLLLVDILLPGIDGATLIMSLRSHPQFAASRLIVMTSLDEADRAPYRLALDGVTVVHKTRLVVELPQRVREALATR